MKTYCPKGAWRRQPEPVTRWFWLAALSAGYSTAARAADVSGYVGVVSEYRDRGVAVSQGRPAVQASALIEHRTGLYAEAWGSSVGRWPDGELDLSAGWAGDIRESLNLDVYATVVAYPWDWAATYVEGTAVLAALRGPATLRTGVSLAPAQGGTRDEAGRKRANAYVFTHGSFDVSALPITLNAGVGYENGAFDTDAKGGKWDWSAGAEWQIAPARAGLSYAGSDSPQGDRHAVIGTLFVDW